MITQGRWVILGAYGTGESGDFGYPQDHDTVHARGFYSGALFIVDLDPAARTVALADREDAITPGNAKKNAVRKILNEAEASFDGIVAEWEKMHR